MFLGIKKRYKESHFWKTFCIFVQIYNIQVQIYTKYIDFPTISHIFSKRNTGLRRYQVWVYLRYFADGRLYLNEKKEIAQKFSISVAHLNRLISSLTQENLLEKQNRYYDTVGKVRFAERFGYLGTKKFAISEEVILDKIKFRTWIYSTKTEMFAVVYGKKLTETQHKEDGQKPFLNPFQPQSATYIANSLKVSVATANRHLKKGEKFNFVAIKRQTVYLPIEHPTKEGAARHLDYLKEDGFNRFFVSKTLKGYGIARRDASEITYFIPYKKTGQKYSDLQMQEVESIKVYKALRNR